MSDMRINDRAAAFVADWRTRTEKQQRGYLFLSIAASIVALVVCVALFFWFQNRNYERIVNQNMQYVQDSAIQEANQVERELQNGEMLITNLARQYANLVKFSDTTIEEKLELITDKVIFDRIAYIAPDGMDTSLEGTAIVSDRNYFVNAMKGENGWEMIDKSRVTGKPSVVFYSPVIVDGEIVGVMAGFYEQGRLDDLFSYQLFNFVPNTYLLLGDGTVVSNSNDEVITDNMLDRLSRKKFIGGTDFDDIRRVVDDESRTTIAFSFVDGAETSVGVIVQFNESDWMILSVLPDSITSSMVHNANRIGTILMIAVIAVFIVMIAVMIISFQRQKTTLEQEMSNAVKSLEETVRDEEKQLSIIESLGDIYSSLYFIDMEESTYQRIKERETTVFAIPDIGEAHMGLKTYVRRFVSEQDEERMGQFLAPGTYRERLEGNDSVSAEYQRKDGGWRRAVLAPVRRDGNGDIISILFGVQQIDSEKQKELQMKKALEEAYEAAQMASKAKTTFLSNMSHDIRTPMNAIVGMTAIAAASLDNTDKVSDCLKKITSSSKHLLGLINEVLDMSKIESGKVDLCEDEFSLSDLIDNLISINQPLIREKNHTLIVKINNVEHEKVIGDSVRLQQVLTNLLSNAIKYTPAGGRIEIFVSEKETNKSTIGWYEVVFKDNGIGMSEEFQKNLFEPFTRANDERIANIQGTGLGMPIAKNIINMMNGDIMVESGINEGTTFTVSFSLKLQAEDDVDCNAFINLPVLVADDDVIACESTCLMLNSLSMNSEWVTSGREAVAKTVEHHINNDDYYAVIIDWKMPDMNGIETAKEIRWQVGADIPIIVISAYDWTDIEQEARAAGVNAFLSKPLFKTRLVGLFNELVGNNLNSSSVSTSQKNIDSIKEELGKYDFSGKRILLVEDNELNREIATELLSMVGLATEVAENGKLGVETFAASQPGYYDLILMDIQMPVMDGYESTSAIRALQHPDARKIPIIAMTANAFASDVRSALNAGMNGHISKPIDIYHVVKILNEYIGN